MQRLKWLWVWALIFSAGLVGASKAAAPPSPSYRGAQDAIEEIRRSWSSPGGRAPQSSGDWNALFDALLENLRAYSKADNDQARQEALGRLEQISIALSIR